MASWHEKHGKWWMLQWCCDWWISLGIHIDMKHKFAAKYLQHYGPYIDIHCGCVIISVGYNPYYSSDWEGIISAGRGGEIVR